MKIFRFIIPFLFSCATTSDWAVVHATSWSKEKNLTPTNISCHFNTGKIARCNVAHEKGLEHITCFKGVGCEINPDGYEWQ